jgi:nucleotide-binding universal stress UspA family protein
VTLLRVKPDAHSGEPIRYRAAESHLNGAQRYLQDIARRYRPLGILVKSVVTGGPTVETILDYATTHSIDAIAMTTHGRTGIRRWVYGSVTSKVLRGFESNMLIVRPPADQLSE